MSFEYDLGFLGGGQLARMSIQAAQRMGLRCVSLDPGVDTPAGQISDNIVGRLNDPSCIAEVLRRSAHVTLENEFIPAPSITEAFELVENSRARMLPAVETLATIQDKLLQRQAFSRSGVPSPVAVAVEGDGTSALQALGFPMVLKARFGGYDGKGTRYARTPEEFESHRVLWGKGGWLAESFVPFVRELAAMVYVEPQSGRAGAFPTMETVQDNHVCSLVFPCSLDATEIAVSAVRAVGGVGLFGVEMFELPDGSIQINELAPRPHNTGHYSLDWGGPSQFDVHVRLACGYPVANIVAEAKTSAVCMANLLGQENAGHVEPALRTLLHAHPRARFHWYGKAESKPGRKMGHLNIIQRPGESIPELVAQAKSAREIFYSAWRHAPATT
jgi:5-(carboxyamino)imidazole ribonucleotide synthase